MTEEIQVVTIGNAFELVNQRESSYSQLTKLAKADESHFGQKTAMWSTRYGFPKIAVCTSRPSNAILNRIYGHQPPPRFIEPKRISSSICADLLEDESAIQALLLLLDRKQKVFIAPYVHTSHVEVFAGFLIKSGYQLIDYYKQAPLVKCLWSKTEAQRLVFEANDVLNSHRPKSMIAHTDEALVNSLRQYAIRGINKVVVKSAAAVGGSGVFYVDTNKAASKLTPLEFLVASGQNEANRSAPFIVEEYVPWDFSPTVDIDISINGQIDFIGTALQRLHDQRYYNGFYYSPLLKERWWFKGVESLAKVVGSRLFELGYTGPANIDFVVSSKDQRISLIEVNPRRSALIDGYGILKLKCGSLNDFSVSAADYVNVAPQFHNITEAFDSFVPNIPLNAEILPVSDGGFSSTYRWVGMLAVGHDPQDSEDVLLESVIQLQDPNRNETGSSGQQLRPLTRISQEAA